MSQQELAAASGVAINTISNAENAHNAINETTWRALETVLGIIPATPQNQA